MRYAKLVTKARKQGAAELVAERQEAAELVAEREKLQQQLNQSQSRIRALEAEIQYLRDHVAPLEKDSRTLGKFRSEIEPAVKHYLGLVEKLAK